MNSNLLTDWITCVRIPSALPAGCRIMNPDLLTCAQCDPLQGYYEIDANTITDYPNLYKKTCQAGGAKLLDDSVVASCLNSKCADCRPGTGANYCFKCTQSTLLVIGNIATNTRCANGMIVKNCAVHGYTGIDTTSSIGCITCDPGFYLDNGTCKEQKIEGCWISSTATTCLLCKKGYKLVTAVSDSYKQGSCIPGTISNCHYASGATSCGVCSQGYYLNSSGACVAITSTTPAVLIGCLQANADGTTCNRCNSYLGWYENTAVSSTSKTCKEEGIDIFGSKVLLLGSKANHCEDLNCATCGYDVASQSQTCLSCRGFGMQLAQVTTPGVYKCNDVENTDIATWLQDTSNSIICNPETSFKNAGGSCQTGGINNCGSYDPSSTTAKCTGCKAGFDLVTGGGACQSTTDAAITGCDLYKERAGSRSCSRCQFGYSLQYILSGSVTSLDYTKCVLNNVQPFCLEMWTDNRCTKCNINKGFFEKTAVQISTIGGIQILAKECETKDVRDIAFGKPNSQFCNQDRTIVCTGGSSLECANQIVGNVGGLLGSTTCTNAPFAGITLSNCVAVKGAGAEDCTLCASSYYTEPNTATSRRECKIGTDKFCFNGVKASASATLICLACELTLTFNQLDSYCGVPQAINDLPKETSLCRIHKSGGCEVCIAGYSIGPSGKCEKSFLRGCMTHSGSYDAGTQTCTRCNFYEGFYEKNEISGQKECFLGSITPYGTATTPSPGACGPNCYDCGLFGGSHYCRACANKIMAGGIPEISGSCSEEDIELYIPNCLQTKTGLDGKPLCLACKVGFIYVYETRTCEKDANQIPNCLQSTMLKNNSPTLERVCLICEEGYNFDPITISAKTYNKNKCTKIGDNGASGTPIRGIDNCRLHREAGECEVCKTGYVMRMKPDRVEIDRSSCIRAYTKFGCLAINAGIRLECGRCNAYEGYYEDTSSLYPDNILNYKKTCVLGDKNILGEKILNEQIKNGKNVNLCDTNSCSRCELVTGGVSRFCSRCVNSRITRYGELQTCDAKINSLPDFCAVSFFKDGISFCENCVIGYYLSGNECKKVTKMINNCVIYSGPETCKACRGGQIPSTADFKSCVPNSNLGTQNCDIFEAANKCLRCTSSYILKYADGTDTLNYGTCNQPTGIAIPAGCLAMDGENKCRDCDHYVGYYESDSTIINLESAPSTTRSRGIYPEKTCKLGTRNSFGEYLTPTNGNCLVNSCRTCLLDPILKTPYCAECIKYQVSEFLPLSKGKCTNQAGVATPAVITSLIPNCVSMKVDGGKSTCELCSKGYFRYLGDCIKISVPNCLIEGPGDQYGVCEVCEEGFIPSNDRYSCVRGLSITKCRYHRRSSTGTLDCFSCKEGYTKVKKYTSPVVFTEKTEECIRMEYGVKGCGRMLEDDLFLGCLECNAFEGYYEIDAKEYAIKSGVPAGSTAPPVIEVIKSCQKGTETIYGVAPVPEKIQYFTAGSCAADSCIECQHDGVNVYCIACAFKPLFKPNGDSSGRCEGTMTDTNCVSSTLDYINENNQICLRCSQNYYLDITDGKCKIHGIANCVAAYKSNGSLYCNLCAEGYKHTADNKVCEKGTVISNCLHQTQIAGKAFCSVCNSGFALKTTASSGTNFGSCVTAAVGCAVIDEANNCLKCNEYLGYYETNSKMLGNASGTWVKTCTKGARAIYG